MQFSKSIPDKVFENSTSAHFIDVLDSLQEYKQGIITDCIRTFNPILCNNKKWLRKYLMDLGFGNLPSELPVAVLQQMLLNADTIMSLRGSYIGLELFVSVVSLGEVHIDASNFMCSMKVIFPDSLAYGYITDSKGPTDHLFRMLYNGDYGDRTKWLYAVGDYSGNFLYGVDINGNAERGTGVTDETVANIISWYYNSNIRYLLSDSIELSYNNFLVIDVDSLFFNGEYPKEQQAIYEYLDREIPRFVGFTDNLIISWNTTDRDSLYYHRLLNRTYVNN